MHKRRKNDECLNCGSELDPVYNYCPYCGQENTDNKVTVKELLGDIISNYITFDSRLGRSIIPFLFKPGKLTLEFLEGKRLEYIHPVRLYLIISVIFFFLVNVGTDSKDFLDVDDKIVTDSTQINLDSLQKLGNDEINKAIKEGNLSTDDSIALESIKKANLYLNKDSLNKIKNSLDTFNFLGTEYLIPTDSLTAFLKRPDMTPDILLDSLHASEKNIINRRFAKKIIKYAKSDWELFIDEILGNIPGMMFIFIPVFAIALKLFYRKRLYIEHLVFTFHIHSFFFTVISIDIILNLIDDYVHIYRFPFIIWSILYLPLMFMNVYKQGWFKTFIKINCLLTLYFILLLFFSIFEIIFSIVI